MNVDQVKAQAAVRSIDPKAKIDPSPDPRVLYMRSRGTPDLRLARELRQEWVCPKDFTTKDGIHIMTAVNLLTGERLHQASQMPVPANFAGFPPGR